MSKFLEKAFGESEGLPQEEVVTEEVVTEEVVEEVPTEEVVTEEVVTEEVVTTEEPEEVVEEIPEKKKVVVDVKEYLESNKETILQVLKKGDTDFSSLSHTDTVRLKIQKENPEWSSEDVDSELEDLYGVGVEKIEIDTDSMSDEEIKEAKAFNKKLDSSARQLKKDGEVARQELRESLESIELPELSYEVEAEVPVDIAKALEDHIIAGQEAIQKERDEVWTPSLRTAIASVDKITEEVTYEIDGVTHTVQADLELTEEDKESIVTELSTYQATEQDSKYLDAQNAVDYDSFLKDKSEPLVRKKLYAQIAKASAEQAVQNYIRENVVNYSSGVRNTAHSSDNNEDIAVGIWKNRKK